MNFKVARSARTPRSSLSLAQKMGVCLSALFLFFCAMLCYRLGSTYFADKFSLGNIRSDLEHDSRWELPLYSVEKKCEAKEILSQPFSYLAKGMQSFVFQSADEKYVLKLFRHHRHRSRSRATAFLPKSLADKIKISDEKRAWKRECFFQSCMVMHNDLAEQTGLVYLHLNKRPDLEQKVVLKDKLHRTFTLDIDQYEFVLQRKATPLLSYVQDLMKKDESCKAQAALSQLLSALENRYLLGIDDRDAVLHRNAGFLEDSPVFLDIGQFYYDEETKNPLFYKSEMHRVTIELRGWLKENYPELHTSFEKELSNRSLF